MRSSTSFISSQNSVLIPATSFLSAVLRTKELSFCRSFLLKQCLLLQWEFLHLHGFHTTFYAFSKTNAANDCNDTPKDSISLRLQLNKVSCCFVAPHYLQLYLNHLVLTKQCTNSCNITIYLSEGCNWNNASQNEMNCDLRKYKWNYVTIAVVTEI